MTIAPWPLAYTSCRLAPPSGVDGPRLRSEAARPTSRLRYFDRVGVRVESQIASGCSSLPLEGGCCVRDFSHEHARCCVRRERCLGRGRSDGSGYSGSCQGRSLCGGDCHRVNGGSEPQGYLDAFRYNRRRRHASIVQISPVDFERNTHARSRTLQKGA